VKVILFGICIAGGVASAVVGWTAQMLLCEGELAAWNFFSFFFPVYPALQPVQSYHIIRVWYEPELGDSDG
jgi:hypothetical protein